MKYKLIIPHRILKTIAKIPHDDRERIFNALQALRRNPGKGDVRKLKGKESWRLRVGRYRVIYEIHDDRRIILIVSMGHRKDIYR